jgi:hypothetical protein
MKPKQDEAPPKAEDPTEQSWKEEKLRRIDSYSNILKENYERSLKRRDWE